MEVFEHILDPIPALQAVRTLLKPDGLLYIGHIGLLHEGWQDIYKFSQIAHPYNHSLATLRMVVESQGFEFVAGDESLNAIFRLNDDAHGPMQPQPGAYGQIVAKFAEIERAQSPIKTALREWKQDVIELLIKMNLLAPALAVLRLLRKIAGSR